MDGTIHIHYRGDNAKGTKAVMELGVLETGSVFGLSGLFQVSSWWCPTGGTPRRWACGHVRQSSTPSRGMLFSMLFSVLYHRASTGVRE